MLRIHNIASTILRSGRCLGSQATELYVAQIPSYLSPMQVKADLAPQYPGLKDVLFIEPTVEGKTAFKGRSIFVFDDVESAKKMFKDRKTLCVRNHLKEDSKTKLLLDRTDKTSFSRRIFVRGIPAKATEADIMKACGEGCIRVIDTMKADSPRKSAEMKHCIVEFSTVVQKETCTEKFYNGEVNVLGERLTFNRIGLEGKLLKELREQQFAKKKGFNPRKSARQSRTKWSQGSRPSTGAAFERAFEK